MSVNHQPLVLPVTCHAARYHAPASVIAALIPPASASVTLPAASLKSAASDLIALWQVNAGTGKRTQVKF
jgi:hypothetical protein